MNITAITKFKQGDLYQILQRLGWSQSELGRRSSIDAGRIGRIINLRKKPTKAQANRIQNAFGEVGEYLDVITLWPERFNGLPTRFKVEDTRDIEFVSLENCQEALQLPVPESDYRKEKFEELYGILSDMEKRALDQKLLTQKSFRKIGRKLGVTGAHVHRIYNNAIAKMKRKKYFSDIEETTPYLRLNQASSKPSSS